MPFPKLLISLAMLLLWQLNYAQEAMSTSVKEGEEPGIFVSEKGQSLAGIRDRDISVLERRYASIERKLTRQTESYLSGLQRREATIFKKLAQKDSVSAKDYLKNSDQVYQRLQSKLHTPADKVSGLKTYLPDLDSLQGVVGYIEKYKNQFSGLSSGRLQALQALQGKVNALNGRMQQAADIQQLLKERSEQLKAQLGNVLGHDVNRWSRQAYYYKAQVQEYKQLLHEPDKLAARLIAVARTMPAFKGFMTQNSWLSQLFPSAQMNRDNGQILAGLQARSQVQQMLGQQLGTPGGSQGNPEQFLQQQLGGAQSHLNQLKDKINNSGATADMAMPGFTPNGQKTKSFLRRLEYGIQLQSQKTNYLLPATTDFSLTAGYKLNDRSVIGLGAGYKLGWGKPVEKISLTSEGLTLKSYIDVKLKGSFWMTGGYEKNYLTSFKRMPVWSDHQWQSAGLIGVMKKMKVGRKTTSMQLLWDFLSYSQVPVGTPLKYRVSYVF